MSYFTISNCFHCYFEGCDLNGLGNLGGDLEEDTSDRDELPRKDLSILIGGCENKSWLYEKWNEVISTSAITD